MRRARAALRALGPGLLVAATLSACGASPESPPRPERIVLVVLDTVRADLLAQPEAAGLGEVARLSAEGATFTRAWSAASYTLPAHATLLTGRDPAEHPLSGPRPRLLRGTPTLAERLRDAGYRTRGFHEGGYLAGDYGFARGFERYTELPRRSLVGERLADVIGWVEANADEPFFLFLHTYAAHDPYGGWDALREAHPELMLPSAPQVRELAAGYPVAAEAAEATEAAGLAGGVAAGPALMPRAHRDLFRLFNPLQENGVGRVRSVALRPVDALRDGPHFEQGVAAMRSGYEARVARTDRMLGTLRAKLEALGLWEDTLLVVTSDHGEAFFEHGQPWHGYVPYEEVLRVPWIVSHPRRFERTGPIAVDAPVWQLDFAPTLLGLAGLHPDASLAGRDLSDALDGGATPDADHAVFPLVLEVETLRPEPPLRVAIRGDLKLVPESPRFHASGDQLFDLADDPGEMRNLIEERPEAALELTRAVRDYEARLKPPPPPLPGETIDEQEREALRELGYAE